MAESEYSPNLIRKTEAVEPRQENKHSLDLRAIQEFPNYRGWREFSYYWGGGGNDFSGHSYYNAPSFLTTSTNIDQYFIFQDTDNKNWCYQVVARCKKSMVFGEDNRSVDVYWRIYDLSAKQPVKIEKPGINQSDPVVDRLAEVIRTQDPIHTVKVNVLNEISLRKVAERLLNKSGVSKEMAQQIWKFGFNYPNARFIEVSEGDSSGVPFKEMMTGIPRSFLGQDESEFVARFDETTIIHMKTHDYHSVGVGGDGVSGTGGKLSYVFLNNEGSLINGPLGRMDQTAINRIIFEIIKKKKYLRRTQ